MRVVFFGSVVLNVLMALLVAVRKARRDRRERRSTTRRDRLRRAVRGDGTDLVPLLRAARRDLEAQADLVAVLAPLREDGPELRRLRAGAGEARLLDALAAQRTARSAAARGVAVLLVGRIGGGLASAVVAPALQDPDPDVRLVAARVLARLGDASAGRALVGALARGLLPRARIAERLGAPWATPVVLEALGVRRPDLPLVPEHRAALVDALGLAAAREAEPLLLRSLAEGASEERIAAAKALSTCGGQGSLVGLVTALSDEAWQVRAQAARSIGELGLAPAVPALEAVLGDPGWSVRANAADALARLGPDGIAALRRAAAGDDRYARERSVEALAAVSAAAGAAA